MCVCVCVCVCVRARARAYLFEAVSQVLVKIISLTSYAAPLIGKYLPLTWIQVVPLKW